MIITLEVKKTYESGKSLFIFRKIENLLEYEKSN